MPKSSSSFFRRWFSADEPDAVETSAEKKRIFEVGWLLDTEQAGVIWETPKPFSADLPKPASGKSATLCPAVIEYDRRHYVIPSPIDLHLRMTQNNQGQLQVSNVAGAHGTVRPGALGSIFVVMPQNEWRHPARPVLQIATPYLFVADDPIYLNQYPPFLQYRSPPLPGVQLCGRFPIDVWPRLLMWAFEWHDLKSDLVLRRGAPLFYVRFETPDPSAQVRLVEAEMTPALRDYTNNITDVTNYVNQTFSLFKTARERRPEKLLVRKNR